MKNIHNTSEITQLMVDLGLEEKQALIYLAALDIGGGNITDLAKRAGIERTNVYYHIGRLMELELLKEAHVGKRGRYIPHDPARLNELLLDRSRRLEQALPRLVEQFQQQSGRSSAVYYEGKDGLMRLYETYYRVLKTLPANTQFMVISRNFVAVEVLPDFLPQFVAKRMKLSVRSRGLFPISERPKSHQKLDPSDPIIRLKYNIKTTLLKKYIPDKYIPGSTVLVFDRYVVMIDWENLFGSLTENRVLADSWAKAFDFMWDHLPAEN